MFQVYGVLKLHGLISKECFEKGIVTHFSFLLNPYYFQVKKLTNPSSRRTKFLKMIEYSVVPDTI
jgi:hypothetical protein